MRRYVVVMHLATHHQDAECENLLYAVLVRSESSKSAEELACSITGDWCVLVTEV